MERWSLGDLIAALERIVAALVTGVPALFRSLRGRPRDRGVTQFGEYEKVEESKYYVPEEATALEPLAEGLPGSYGRTRLVLMAMDPYVIHAYWEVTPDKLAAARAEMGSGPAQAVLRFWDQANGNRPDAPAPAFFDVHVDLDPRNWYVNLWAANKAYRVHLGLKSADGDFAPLAESNLIRTPRAWPVMRAEENFSRVDPARQRIEPVPAPPMSLHRPGEHTARQPMPSAVPAPDQPLSTSREEVSHSRPGGLAVPAGSAETLRRKLTELYAFRDLAPGPAEVDASAPNARAGGIIPKRREYPARRPLERQDEPADDLTGTAERRFEPGISSQGDHRRGPER